MLLKDSGQRDFPAGPLLGKLRFGYPRYVNFHKERCMAWPQPPCNRLCNSKMEYQGALKPTSTLKNFVPHVGTITSNIAMAFQKKGGHIQLGSLGGLCRDGRYELRLIG